MNIPQHAHPLVRALIVEQRRLGISQKELENRSGVSLETVNNWRKATNPSLVSYLAVLNALGLDLAIVPREGG